jgi:hypothetical protein
VNPTPILEEIQQPPVEAMSIDTLAAAQEPQNQEVETMKEMQPEHTKSTPKVNGMTPNSEAPVEPNESQTTISEHPVGEKGEDVLAWLEWVMKEQPEATRTSSQPPPQQKDKIQIPRSPRKKLTA